MTRRIHAAEKLPKSHKRSVWIVLPAYNEAENLGALLDKIDIAMTDHALAYEVVVVDDGSQDNTAEIIERHASRMPIRLERHPKNMGLGATIRDGLRLATSWGKDGDVIVAMDADNTHTPELIPRMVGLVREGNDVVIASRFQKGATVKGVPFLRQIFSLVASLLFRTILPIKGVRDFTCGYRAYRREALNEAFDQFGNQFVSFSGFEAMPDILLKLSTMNLIFTELPMILRYDLKRGESKMHVSRNIFRTLRLIIRRRIGGSRSF